MFKQGVCETHVNLVLKEMSLTDYINQCNTHVQEGHSQQCKEQIDFLKSVVKDNRVKRVLEFGFNAGHSSEIFLTNTPIDAIVVSFFDINEHSCAGFGKTYIDKTFPNSLIFKTFHLCWERAS